MLKLEDVHVSYSKSRVINGVSMTIEQGGKVCLIGRNGVGKTTLLKSIMGLQPVETGKVFLNELDITKYKTYRRSKLGIAYVPQGREIIPMLTVKENLQLGSMCHSPKDESKLMEEVLTYFPALNEHMQRKGGVLSGGQQQQLAIARALMSNPKILILDEPSEGIQPNVVAEIANIISLINKDKNISILLVEQNLQFAKKVTDQYFIMEKGKIIASGSFEEVEEEEIKKYLTI